MSGFKGTTVGFSALILHNMQECQDMSGSSELNVQMILVCAIVISSQTPLVTIIK